MSGRARGGRGTPVTPPGSRWRAALGYVDQSVYADAARQVSG